MRGVTVDRSTPWIAALLLLFSGCGQNPDPRGQRVEVGGTVTLDGLPLANGSIRLISDQGKGQVKAKASIREGAFRFREQDGPLSGEARVEIYPPILELEQLDLARSGKDPGFTPVTIPSHYNRNSTLTATIEPTSDVQILTFELRSLVQPCPTGLSSAGRNTD